MWNIAWSNRDSNAVTITDKRGTVHVPAATLSVLMLGPGSTVTHAAISLLAESRATCIWVGEQGVRYYCHGASLSRSTRLLEAQAKLVSSERSRLKVARHMYEMRFPNEDTSRLTMQQLLGKEGTRVRRAYERESARAAASAAVEGEHGRTVRTPAPPRVMPYGVEPGVLDERRYVLQPHALGRLVDHVQRPPLDLLQVAAGGHRGTAPHIAFDACVSFSKDDVLSTELGMTI